MGLFWVLWRAAVDRSFDSPGLHVKVSLGKILNPKLLLMFWLAACMAATTISVSMFVCMNYCKLLWTKAPAKYPKCKWKFGLSHKALNYTIYIIYIILYHLWIGPDNKL